MPIKIKMVYTVVVSTGLLIRIGSCGDRRTWIY